MTSFDALEHHRRRTREAETRARGLERMNDELLAAVARAVQTVAALIEAFTRTPIDPADIARALLEPAEPRSLTDDELIALLRDPSPEQPEAAAA